MEDYKGSNCPLVSAPELSSVNGSNNPSLTCGKIISIIKFIWFIVVKLVYNSIMGTLRAGLRSG